MPRTRSLAWSELKIGVLTFAAIAIAALLIFSLAGTKGFSWQRYPLKTRFKDVAGLASGSPVRVAGVEVGTVRAVEFAGEDVDISFDVKKDMRSRITDKSAASLGSVSLLGESAIDITPATSGTPIPDYGYVPAAVPKGSFASMSATAQDTMQSINGLVTDLRQGRGTAGKFMTDDRLYTEMQQFVGSADEVVRTIKSGRGTVGKLLSDPRTANALEASARNLEDLTRRINAGEGSLGKLLHDESFSNSLNGATANLRDLTDRLNRGEGTIGKLMTDDAMYKRLNDVSDRLDELVTKLNSGEGTLGQLLKDKQLYENMNKTVNEFHSLLTEIKKDPRRYLNVKVSIF